MTKAYTIRIDEDLLNKIHYMASYEGRSGNGQMIYIFKQAVRSFEARHGPIPLAPIRRKP